MATEAHDARAGRVWLVRPHRERVAAWLYTGPIAHLYSALADIGVLLVRYAFLRLRAAKVIQQAASREDTGER